jgi:glycosyltransferase involved in cell wall biosynthesis
VPSNIPVSDQEETDSVRRKLLANDRFLVGHFGTYGPGADDCLAPALRLLKEKASGVRFVLLGRGGGDFLERNSDLRSFSTAAASLHPKPLAAHLAACDVMLQPYPGGVNARRSTVMACLVNGVPTVANLGRLSESLWMEGGVALADDDPESLASVAAGLLSDEEERNRLSRAGVEFYHSHFSIERVVGALLGERVGV